MNTMGKIFVVSEGSYSDYRIVAPFTTLELAKEFMALVPDDYNEVEQFDLNPDTVDFLKRGYSIFGVRMLRDGNTESVKRKELDSYVVIHIGYTILRRSQAPMYAGKDVADVLLSTVWAKSEAQAVKITNEHRAQMIANGEWT